MEIETLNGYNIIPEPIKITIGWTAPTDETKDCTWSYKQGEGESESTTDLELVGGVATITVENRGGAELPSTGGISTTNPNDPTNPSDSNGGGTTNPNGGTGSPSSPSTTKPSDKIPQTGMLEWPIPLMFEFGAAFIVIGIVFCIRKKNENEE